MDSSAEFAAGTEAHHAHRIAILLAKEGYGSHLAGLGQGQVAVFVQRQVLPDELVDEPLYLAELLVGDFLEVGKVEAQRVGRDKRAFLLDVRTEHLLEGVVEQVGGGVIGGTGGAFVGVDAGHEGCRGVLREVFDDVDALVVLALGVEDVDGLFFIDEHPAVAYLSAHLSVERGVVEHELVVAALLLGDLSVAQDATFVLGVVVAYEGLFTLVQHGPVGVLDNGGVPSPLFLLLHLCIELLGIDRKAVLPTNQLGEIEGEAVGVEETEGLPTVEGGFLLGSESAHLVVEQSDSLLQGSQEGVFFFFDDATNELALGLQLGIGLAHLPDEDGEKLVDEGRFLVEEGVGIAYGAAQNAADDVAGLGVAGQLTVGDGEGYGSEVIGNDAHGDIDLLVLPIGFSREARDFLYDGLEDVGVVVGSFALQSADEAFEAHAGVDDMHGKLVERAVGATIELHEDDVPDFDHLGMVFVDEILSGRLLLLFGRTGVEVYL